MTIEDLVPDNKKPVTFHRRITPSWIIGNIIIGASLAYLAHYHFQETQAPKKEQQIQYATDQ
jgi:hypothetical protein